MNDSLGESSPDPSGAGRSLAKLGDADRDALVLRFFKNEDLRAVGTALGTSEDAAQKRVTRALEKLRAYELKPSKPYCRTVANQPETHALNSPTASTQRAHKVGCSLREPTSVSQCQHRSHF